MQDSWTKLIGSVLRPARPDLERCLRERASHLASVRLLAEERTRAITRCQARMEAVREAVFAAKDGKVTSEMTDLEREWRRLSRADPDGTLMDLWASVAPLPWLDRKLWRDSEPATQLDAAVALAADVAGVETAESAIASLRASLAPWGIPVGSRLRWRFLECDADCTSELLAEPLGTARAALAARGLESVVLERAQELERDVREAVRVRFPERPLLARGLAHAASVDCAWRAAGLVARPNPVAALSELWAAGYAIAAVDASDVILEIPRL